MICVDTSVIIPWLRRETYPETTRLHALVEQQLAALAPVCVTELLSDTGASGDVAEGIDGFHVLDLQPGYWERAGLLRAALRRNGRKAPMADALIAQACIDADMQLLTRDADFKAYAKLFALKLA